MKSLLLVLLGLCWLGCAGTAPSTDQPLDVITVEGRASVRGNTPFTAVMLETDQRNLYVLVLDDADRQTLERELPARLRITGVLYVDDWNGVPYAHLRPTSLEQL